MFRKNNSYHQQDLFGVSQQLTKKQQEQFEASIEHRFFEEIFCNIDEQRFSVLYTDKKSRPNVPVNQLVGSLILKHLFDWTYEELFKHMSFNLLTRHAIGIDRLDTDIFAEASLFNFQNRLLKHYVESGQDLLMEVFDSLTSKQLDRFGIKADIQRGDSFLIGSNIVDYNRLQLLIEVLKRFYRVLEEQDKKAYKHCFDAYLRKSSGQYIYRVEKADLSDELNKLGVHYHKLHLALVDKYSEINAFKVFSRVYHEHFCIVSDKVAVRAANELNSSILLSPDDTEATFRDKNGKKSKGYVGHLSETINPHNQFQLITDVTTEPNNIGDAEILEKRLPDMIIKTPELKEYFSDGQYGGPKSDKIMHKNNIKQYQSGIRGKRSAAGIRIHQKQDDSVWVKCNGGQDVQAVKRRGWSASFDFAICNSCPLASKCNTKLLGVKKRKPRRVWYFQQRHILAHLRINNFDTLPKEKKTLRASVEASVRQLQCGMKNGKVRVRTKLRIDAYIILTAIAINLKRIHVGVIDELNRYLNYLFQIQDHSLLKGNYNKIEITNFIIKNQASLENNNFSLIFNNRSF